MNQELTEEQEEALSKLVEAIRDLVERVVEAFQKFLTSVRKVLDHTLQWWELKLLLDEDRCEYWLLWSARQCLARVE